MRTTAVLFVIALMLNACSETKSEAALTGNDKDDITDIHWLYKVQRHDHFLYFAEDESGWEANIDDSEVQWHVYFPKRDFLYSIDSLNHQIHLFYKEDGKEQTLAYELKFDNRRILVLNREPYEDGQYEMDRFAEKGTKMPEQGINTVTDGVKLYQDINNN